MRLGFTQQNPSPQFSDNLLCHRVRPHGRHEPLLVRALVRARVLAVASGGGGGGEGVAGGGGGGAAQVGVAGGAGGGG